MLQITLTTTKLEKTGKVTYKPCKEQEVKTITQEQYKNICEAGSFMKRLGGTESNTKSYTSYGYCITRIVSTSPDRNNRTVREFQFEYIN